MPVQHIVWIRFDSEVSDERINEHMAALASLKDRVPGINELSLGENFTERADGCTHGLIVTLEDKPALEAYAVHPAHVEVATALQSDATLLALDYEF